MKTAAEIKAETVTTWREMYHAWETGTAVSPSPDDLARALFEEPDLNVVVADGPEQFLVADYTFGDDPTGDEATLIRIMGDAIDEAEQHGLELEDVYDCAVNALALEVGR